MADGDDKNASEEYGVAASDQGVRTGAIAIAQTLKASGIDLIFGYAGGGTNALIDGIVKAGPPSISARTEISAAWMSYGYNRALRRPASACLFHCVGALHASPVVYGATVDGTPFVLMTVSVDSSIDVREALQDSKEVSASLKPIAKYAMKMVKANDLPLAVRQAVQSAGTGRPGSSVLDFAFQVLIEETDCIVEPLRLPASPAMSQDAIDEAIALLKQASRPILIVGAGVQLAGASAELVAFAEEAGIPVVSTSWGGRGVMSDEHPLYAGVMGSFGWINANELAQRSDLWIAIGTSFSQMTTAAWNIEKPARVIQIDIDPYQLGKIFQPTLGIVSDARLAVGQLRKAASDAGIRDAHEAESLSAVTSAKAEWFDYLEQLKGDGGSPINQYFVIDAMARTFPEGTIMVADSGMHAFMMYRAFRYMAPTPLVQGSRYMSLGSGLPTAIGAKLALPDKTVVCFHGDGGLYYDIADLSFMAEHGIKVILVIDNNGYLAANRSSAIIMKLENPWLDLPNTTTDFVAVAKAFGVAGERVEKAEDLEAAFRRAMESPGPYVVDVVTDPDTRIKRAVKDVVPIISDRAPQKGGEGHVSPTTRRAWPK